MKKYLYFRLFFLIVKALRCLNCLVLSETHPVSVALIIALVRFEERGIATFSVKTNLLRAEQTSKKSDSHKNVYVI